MAQQALSRDIRRLERELGAGLFVRSTLRVTLAADGERLLPLDALAGQTVYAGAGNPRTPEWTDLALHLFEGRGIGIAPPAPLAVGDEEFQRVMAKTRNPVLAVMDFSAMPRTVLRPLVDPVPLSLVSMVWRKGLVHPGFDALRRAVVQLSEEENWLRRPVGGWIPAIDLNIIFTH